MKTVLITGAAGYLGSHLAKTMKRAGWKVVGLVHKRQPPIHYFDGIYPCDIRDPDGLFKVFSRHKFDLVIHLAGRIEAGISFKEPTEFYSVNTGGTCNLINQMDLWQVKNIIFSSTAAVYKAQNIPIIEDSEKANNSPYGNSKLCAEMAIQDSGLNYLIFRYFNLTGADPDGEFGEDHEPETHLVPQIIKNLNNFQLNGNDYNTPDGTCVRDYVHVSDVAEAHVNAANYLQEGNKSIIVNLGTGQGQSILQMLNALEQITNQKIAYTVNPRRSGDADSLVADITLAKNVLNYRPKYNMFDILKTAYKWHKK